MVSLMRTLFSFRVYFHGFSVFVFLFGKIRVVTKNSELEKSSMRKKLFKTELLQLTADELNYSLCLFVKEVRKPNGSEYAPDTIYYLVLGIQEYLYENGRIDNIFTDPYYERFTDCLDDVAKKFSVLYNDSRKYNIFFSPCSHCIFIRFIRFSKSLVRLCCSQHLLQNTLLPVWRRSICGNANSLALIRRMFYSARSCFSTQSILISRYVLGIICIPNNWN